MMNALPTSSPFVHSDNQVQSLMLQVLAALLPGLMAYIYFFGWGVLINLCYASVLALALEALMLWLRRRPLLTTLSDGSVLVTASLLALALPPLAPWWLLFIGLIFAVVFAKHLYGGLGQNLFNPAMVAYAVLLISFPAQMSFWPVIAELSHYQPSFIDSFKLIFFETLPTGFGLDALTSATSLDTMKNLLDQAQNIAMIKKEPIFGDFGAKGWEWINNGYLLGGLWLIYRGVIRWHIPVAVLGSLFLTATLFFFLDSDVHPSPLFHMFSGAAILGAFFIATDPVTAATSTKGKLIFGFGIGVLIYVIRTWGSYPDAVAFSVLIMNMFVPMLDYYSKPRVFGTTNHPMKNDDHAV